MTVIRDCIRYLRLWDGRHVHNLLGRLSAVTTHDGIQAQLLAIKEIRITQDQIGQSECLWTQRGAVCDARGVLDQLIVALQGRQQ